jgi:hypothetical protein
VDGVEAAADEAAADVAIRGVSRRSL